MARDRQSMGSVIPLQNVTVNFGRTASSGGDFDGWFGPLNPMHPIAPDSVKGRILDYPSGYNLNIRPRSYSGITYEMLRNFADSYDLLRLMIETRKDQMARLNWNIVPRDKSLRKKGAKIPGDVESRINSILEFFLMPDKENFWGDWLRMLLEDLFVIDAPTIYRRKTYGGDLFALQPLDGGTIKRVIDDHGNTPESPEVAYQQVLKGYPAVDYSTDELIWRPRNKRTHKIYGYSPVEQVIMTINIGMRRQTWQLQSFTEGNIPEALIGTPATWTPDQVRQFQDWFDSVMQGNTAERSRARFVPGEVAKGYIPTKPTELFGQAEEWLVRVICFAFNVSPQPFVNMMNRATAETAQETAISEGLAPTQNWVKGLMDLLLIQDFESPDLEFMWEEEDEPDPNIKSQIVDREHAAGRLSFNEARREQGLDPIDHPDADRPMFKGTDGWKPIFLTPEEEAEAEAMKQKLLEGAGDKEGGEGGGDVPGPGGNGEELDSGEVPPGDEEIGKAAGMQPREPKGSSKGGQFKSKGSGGAISGLTPESIGKHQAKLDAKAIQRRHGKNPDKARELARTHDQTARNYSKLGVSSPIVEQVSFQAEHLRRIADKWEGSAFGKSDQPEVAEESPIPFLAKGDGSEYEALPGGPLDTGRKYVAEREKRLSKKTARNLKALRSSVIEQVKAKLDEVAKTEYPDDFDVDALLNGLDLEVLLLLEDDFKEVLSQVAADGGRAALSMVGAIPDGTDFADLTEKVNERALVWAENNAADLVSLDDEMSLQHATRDMLRTDIANGIRDNLSTGQIASVLEQNYAFSEERAQTIAATETTSANSEGALIGYKEAEELGINVKKSWLRLGDACEVCADNAAQGAIPLDEEFQSGDKAPGAHPHCRCVLVPEVDDDATKADFREHMEKLDKPLDVHDDSPMSRFFPVNLKARGAVWEMGGNNEDAEAERAESLLMFVPFDQCVATQNYCDYTKVQQYLDDPTGSKTVAPMAYLYEGTYYIQDGHHRTVASLMSGNGGMAMFVKKIDVLIDLE